MKKSVAIVGAGPAGIWAALAARRWSLDVQLVDAAGDVGGQLHRIYSRISHPPENAARPLRPEDADGEAFLAGLRTELAEAKIFPELRTRIVGLRRRSGEVELRRASGSSITARAVLVATGLRLRRLGVPGEKELEGRGVSTSATRDRQEFAGRPVVVVGGGDAAYENALLLAEVGSPVTLVVREAPRARAEFRTRVAAEPRIQVLENARVEAILGERRVGAVRVATAGGSREIEAAGVFVKIGAVPNTEWCKDAVDTDEFGFIRAAALPAGGRTSLDGVWAAGDVLRDVAGFTLTHARRSAHGAVEAIAEALK